jgi:hypothetical protein
MLSGLVFGNWSVRISTGTPTILTDVFRGFPQSLQANSGWVLLLGYDRFLPNPLQFIYHPTIRRYVISILKASLNNPRKKRDRKHNRYLLNRHFRPHFITCLRKTIEMMQAVWPVGNKFNKWGLVPAGNKQTDAFRLPCVQRPAKPRSLTQLQYETYNLLHHSYVTVT